MTMPAQNPGKSKQDFGTPRDFLDAVEHRFGPILVDLACHNASNSVAPLYYAESFNSLIQPWASDLVGDNGVRWLNPPFGDIATWAAKCAEEGAKLRRGRILMLTPASIGANWFADHVHGKAYVIGLSPRMTFVGAKDPYPKDLMLSVFGGGVRGFDTWRWKGDR